MIIHDFNAVAVSEAMALVGYEKSATAHDVAAVVLSKLSQISTKYKQKYGRTVVCCEGEGNWRKGVYPSYKKNRRVSKAKSTIDWDMFYEGFNIAIELIDYEMQWACIQVPLAEADDSIAVIASGVQEKTLIVSRDSDFFQLHNSMIDQYDFQTNKMLKGEKGAQFFHEKYVKGSSKENIANIQMPIDHLTEGKGKQKAVTKKFLEGLVLEGDLLKRYNENKALMDLAAIPEDVQQEIRIAYRIKTKNAKPTIKEMGDSLRNAGFRILARNVEDFID